MDFFQGQESLTSIQWVLRAIIAFFFLLLVCRIMGQRSIAQLRLLDYTMALLLGNIIAHPLSDEGLGLKGSMISMSVLVFLYSACIFFLLKSQRFRHWLDPSPYPIIENGQIINKNLAKAKISIDYLLAELRKEKIDDVNKVALALWEADGTFSFVLHSPDRTLTPKDMHLTPSPFAFPRTIIKEGKIDFEELNHSGKDKSWLKNKLLTTYNAEIKDILLATIDNTESMKIIWYKNRN
jgi:uncharacterized membrane protein YcaP (DUF421 family)